jgi:hypothetical protein
MPCYFSLPFRYNLQIIDVSKRMSYEDDTSTNSRNKNHDDESGFAPYKKSAPVKYKKAPQAPRRFKSAYMFFSTQKHKDIREELIQKGETNKVWINRETGPR